MFMILFYKNMYKFMNYYGLTTYYI